MRNSLGYQKVENPKQNYNKINQLISSSLLAALIIPSTWLSNTSGGISSIPTTYNHLATDAKLEEHNSPKEYLLNNPIIINAIKSYGVSVEDVDAKDVWNRTFIIHKKETSNPIRIVWANMATQIPVILQPWSADITKNLYAAVARTEWYDIDFEDSQMKFYRYENDQRTEEVDILSKEFVNAWKNINFFANRFQINHFLLDPEYEVISYVNKQGHLRIKDLLNFKDNLTEQQFQQELEMANYRLIFQVEDERFEMAWDPITVWELNWYLEEGYITRFLYERVKNRLTD